MLLRAGSPLPWLVGQVSDLPDDPRHWRRYGAVPVVRRTGGLADTVKDVDAADAGETPNGFTFDGVDEASEDGALDRALAYFRRKDWWAEVCDVLLSPGETNQR